MFSSTAVRMLLSSRTTSVRMQEWHTIAENAATAMINIRLILLRSLENPDQSQFQIVRHHEPFLPGVHDLAALRTGVCHILLITRP